MTRMLFMLKKRLKDMSTKCKLQCGFVFPSSYACAEQIIMHARACFESRARVGGSGCLCSAWQ